MTIEFYDSNAEIFFKSTIGVDMAELYAPFVKTLPPGAKILDAGCGSGRDSKVFLNMGYEVDAFDASEEMVRRAAEHTGLEVKKSFL